MEMNFSYFFFGSEGEGEQIKKEWRKVKTFDK